MIAVAPSVLLIACGALARETLAVVRASRLDHIAVTCLPAILHNRPNLIPDRLRQRIRTARAQGYGSIFVLYADCGTGGGIDAVCAEEGVERIAGPHCYSFYAGAETFDALMEEEIGTFFLTDYLARHFDRLVMEGLGLDRHPELRELMFGHYRRLVYLSQSDDPALLEKASAAADRLALAFEHRPTGYGDLASFVRNVAENSSPAMEDAAPPPHPDPLPRGEMEKNPSPLVGEGGTRLRSRREGEGGALLNRARDLRHNSTTAERRLWRALRSRQFEGWKFRRQVPFRSYVLDFVCFDARLVVEVDGDQHADRREADLKRTRALESEGFEVARFWNNEVMGNLDGVLESLRQRLGPPPPHPNPLPRGEREKRPSPLVGEGGTRRSREGEGAR